MAFLHGYNGLVRFKPNTGPAFSFQIHRWMSNLMTNAIDVTNFRYYGGGGWAASVVDAEFNVDAIYDTTTNPYLDTSLIVPGIVTELHLYLQTSPPLVWLWPRVIVFNLRHTHAVRDVSRWSMVMRPFINRLEDVPTFPGV